MKNLEEKYNKLLQACKQLINAPHQEHFAIRLNDEELKGLDAIKECLIYEQTHALLNNIMTYKWKLVYDTDIDKKYGSVADLYFKLDYDHIQPYYMLIDDGAIELTNTVYHIYTNDNLTGKIFEGQISNVYEFDILMKMLGIRK